MASIDQTIVATALGTLQHDLHAAINWASCTGYRLPMIVGFAITGIGTALLAFPVGGVSIASSLVARSSHPGLTQASMFVVLAVILVLMIPLTFLVPEHHGSW